MIDYIIAENPDDRILQKASALLKAGEVIAFPTDTNWVFACSTRLKKGVDKLYQMKKADAKKHFSMICNTISQASIYAYIDDFSFKKIKRLIPGPFTFIFNPTPDIPKVIRSYRKDKEIGIRFPDSLLCQKLIEVHEGPLLTSSISAELLEDSTEGEENLYLDSDSEIYGYQIELAYGHLLGQIIDPGEFHLVGASTIVDFSDKDNPEGVVLRQGAGTF